MENRGWRLLAVIAVGGAIGALARAGVGLALVGQAHAGAWATLAVNVVGSLVIGVLATRLPVSGRWWPRPLLITGVLGGFTTYSAYALETAGLLDRPGLAAMYLVVTVVAGLLAASLGARAARP